MRTSQVERNGSNKLYLAQLRCRSRAHVHAHAHTAAVAVNRSSCTRGAKREYNESDDEARGEQAEIETRSRITQPRHSTRRRRV